MKKFNFKASAKKTFDIEISSLKNLSNSIEESFNEACEAILKCNSSVIIIGVGKSGHVGRKISATLASTGTKAYFIHPTEAAHGDMGVIDKKDVIILISNSGESEEIISILPSLRRSSAKIISITNNKDSTISSGSDIKIYLHVSREACPHNLAPTSSTTASMVLGDALSIALLESRGFKKEDFAISHPGGKLGKRLITKVSDLAIFGKDLPAVDEKTVLIDAMEEVSNKGLGVTFVKNKNRIIGIFTDGDLRRCINEGYNLNTTQIKKVMTKKFKFINEDDLAVNAANIMENNKILTLAVKSGNKITGLITMHNLMQAKIL